MSTTLPTQNEAWGFTGTCRHHGASPAATRRLWDLASIALVNETGCNAWDARAFLDSKHGRHFADDVMSGIANDQPEPRAVQSAADKWMGWRITPRLSRETGIPHGLAYLTGFVVQAGIDATIEAEGEEG
jgi:hypothetical protein